LTDWKGFYEELQNESARAAVIIASAFLDAQLRDLISKSFVDDHKIVDELLGAEDNSDGPLSTFSSRIKAAYCLGLISKSMYYDLNLPTGSP
jgi:DNA-binding MltR family transcriptional regulator